MMSRLQIDFLLEMVSSPVAWKHSLRSLHQIIPCCRVVCNELLAWHLECRVGLGKVILTIRNGPPTANNKKVSVYDSFVHRYFRRLWSVCVLSERDVPRLRSHWDPIPVPESSCCPVTDGISPVESRLSILSGGVIPLNLARSSGLRSCRPFSSRSLLVCDDGQVWW